MVPKERSKPRFLEDDADDDVEERFELENPDRLDREEFVLEEKPLRELETPLREELEKPRREFERLEMPRDEVPRRRLLPLTEPRRLEEALDRVEDPRLLNPERLREEETDPDERRAPEERLMLPDRLERAPEERKLPPREDLALLLEVVPLRRWASVSSIQTRTNERAKRDATIVRLIVRFAVGVMVHLLGHRVGTRRPKRPLHGGLYSCSEKARPATPRSKSKVHTNFRWIRGLVCALRARLLLGIRAEPKSVLIQDLRIPLFASASQPRELGSGPILTRPDPASLSETGLCPL